MNKKSLIPILSLVILYSFYNLYFVENEISLLDYKFYLKDLNFYVYFLISLFFDLILIYSLVFRKNKKTTTI
ncbi:hypothetical protein SAMN05421818_11423 [Myroides phaeus]|uniref:Uncharacterized protein n=1 Tax=Myroides phaeus TaxID=702745 RepID=A0A1G8F3C1_9FLAO|nr:hypothetical protein SAMN05421818_11423 [Myroides phaeus]